MKNSTIAVMCSFAALFYFITITPTALMWMDQTAANNPWFWEPVTQSEIWASRLIFGEVMGVAFLPLFTFFILAFMAWRDHNREQPTINFNNDAGSGSGPKRPLAPPSFRPAPPARRLGPPPPRHGMTAATA
jgi:hypothetical protein